MARGESVLPASLVVVARQFNCHLIRYIARALEEVYTGVLKRWGHPSGIDYLEKIIQIPYRMRPLSPANVEQYLASQVVLREKDADEGEEDASS